MDIFSAPPAPPTVGSTSYAQSVGDTDPPALAASPSGKSPTRTMSLRERADSTSTTVPPHSSGACQSPARQSPRHMGISDASTGPPTRPAQAAALTRGCRISPAEVLSSKKQRRISRPQGLRKALRGISRRETCLAVALPTYATASRESSRPSFPRVVLMGNGGYADNTCSRARSLENDNETRAFMAETMSLVG